MPTHSRSSSTKLTIETEFPAATDERLDGQGPDAKSAEFGAFGEMELSRDPNASTPVKFRDSQNPESLRFLPSQSSFHEEHHAPEQVYKTTVNAPVYQPHQEYRGMSNGVKTTEKFRDVVSNSSDTVEFGRGLLHIVEDTISPFIFIGIFAAVCIWAIAMITVGALHTSHCSIDVKIPIFLIVDGSVLLIACCFRIYSFWPVPNHQHKSVRTHVIRKVFEAAIWLFLLVILILGCVWIYGARPYVHFEEHMFEPHYCDMGLYWFAWVTVTLQLLFIAMLLLATMIFVMLGICKEGEAQQRDNTLR